MPRTSWTDLHQLLLARSAPPSPPSPDAQVERTWSRVTAAVDLSTPRRRRPRRLTLGVGVAAAVLGTSAVASAAIYSAHTGQGPIDAEDLRLGGPGERLDPAAADFGTVLGQETSDIAFPDSESRSLALRDQVELGARGGAVVAMGAVRAWVADAALCAWSNQWARAVEAGDEQDRSEAVKAITTAPSWPAVVAVDPAPYSHMTTTEVTDENGVMRTERLRDDSQFHYLGALGRAASNGNRHEVEDLLAENNGYCSAALVPAIPRANAMFRSHGP